MADLPKPPHSVFVPKQVILLHADENLLFRDGTRCLHGGRDLSSGPVLGELRQERPQVTYCKLYSRLRRRSEHLLG